MLDFLVLSGQIDERDGLLATWFHRANSKEEMNKALAGNAQQDMDNKFHVCS